MNWTEHRLFTGSSFHSSFLGRRGAVTVSPLVPSSPFLSLVLGSASLSLVLRARLKVFAIVRLILRRRFFPFPQSLEVGMPAPKKRSPAPAPKVVHPNAAGIDVGSEAHVVAVPVDRDPEPVRPFGFSTADLRTLADWLKRCAITTVVLESTGVYWMSLCDFLEAQGFEVLVVDPRSLARNLKKKTDVSDAAWLQELHAFGLLKSCFRPDPEVRALRTLWRHRDHLVPEAAKLLQMMQKVLVQMNVYLHLAVNDIAGVTGMRILRAIAQGHHDPQTLAGLRDPNCKKNRGEVAKGREGALGPGP